MSVGKETYELKSALADVINENHYNKQAKKEFLQTITKKNDIRLPLKSDSVMVNQKGQVFLKLKKERKPPDNQKSQAKLIAYDL